ncbi:GntR family transcriptional regulator [Marinomonas arenicola]|uniref:GntR family transcriptional regulator n=1 Tax=Marinomonas arenicola TaxID=569601 RepID=UPI00311E3E50
MELSKRGHDERLPLYQQVRDEIFDNIQRGVWLPDVAIPTEAELTKHYGVAIGTIRKAVDTLVADGVLYRSQGRGTFVRRPDFSSSLFRFFRQVSADGKVSIPTGNILSRTLMLPAEHIARSLKFKPNEVAIRLERNRVLDNSVVLTEEIWLPESLFASLADIELTSFGNLLYPFYEKQCGLLVASATETLSIESAMPETASVLGIDEGRPVAVIERIAYSYDKTPLEYRISRGPAETFRYQVNIS